jgi:putative transposase
LVTVTLAKILLNFTVTLYWWVMTSHNADQITVRDEDGRLICYAKWNANKRAYFPQTKVEQARQRRADGRLRRLAVKQDEVLQK